MCSGGGYVFATNDKAAPHREKMKEKSAPQLEKLKTKSAPHLEKLKTLKEEERYDLVLINWDEPVNVHIKRGEIRCRQPQ